MTTSNDLLSQESHFEFGKNWASYAKLITQTEIDSAEAELQRLLGGRLDGKRFLDIGCGSGLHSLAAIRLGASEVVAVDIDPNSVETTVRVLSAYAAERSWRAVKVSVFDIDPTQLGQFDVVYSWGVLHHTGAMYRALELAAKMLRPGGDFAFALYRSTPFCWLWKIEKRWYARAGRGAQAAARWVYVSLVRLRLLLRFRTYRAHLADYYTARGMDYLHDVHDWMGGWPYESISPGNVDRLMRSLGLRSKRSFLLPALIIGFFGSGCDEYVYSRPERT